MIGTLRVWNEDRGFGFIRMDAGPPDIFLHVSAIKTAGILNLAPGDRLEFDTKPDSRGRGDCAANVRRLARA